MLRDIDQWRKDEEEKIKIDMKYYSKHSSYKRDTLFFKKYLILLMLLIFFLCPIFAFCSYSNKDIYQCWDGWVCGHCGYLNLFKINYCGNCGNGR